VLVTQVVLLAFAAGVVVGLLARRRAAFLLPLALYAIPVTRLIRDRDSFSQEDSTATLLIMYAMFVLAPALLGTAIGLAVGRRWKPPRTRLDE
jgi:hypothetical protein